MTMHQTFSRPGCQAGKAFTALSEQVRAPLERAALGGRVALLCRDAKQARIALEAADTLLGCSSLEPTWETLRPRRMIRIGFGFLQFFDVTFPTGRRSVWPGPVFRTADAWEEITESQAETWRELMEASNGRHGSEAWPPMKPAAGA